MKQEEIRAAVLRALRPIAPEMDAERLDEGARLRAALDIDSFDFLNFMVGIQRELGVAIPEADYGQVATLRDLLAYLQARCGGATGGGDVKG